MVACLVLFPLVGTSEAKREEFRLSLAPGTDLLAKHDARAKVGQALFNLYLEFESHLRRRGADGVRQFQPSNRELNVVDGYVVIDAVAAGDPGALRTDLQALKMQDLAAVGSYVSGRLPILSINKMAALESLNFASPAYCTTHAGTVSSQGDAAMQADIARALFSVDGRGVKVGTMSDSYNCLGGADTDVANGDLPAGIDVLDDSACPGGTDEGRGMMQLVADTAPGADQAFHTAFGGQANFAQGIIDLKDAGCDVIVDDVIYFAEPMFQDGIIARSVDTVVAAGVSYFSSAGNSARNSYESSFDPSGIDILIGSMPAGEAHDFDPGSGVDIMQSVTVPGMSSLIVSFQWDSPFFSLNGPPGSPSDLDIFLLDESESFVLAGSVAPNIGGDPVEVVVFTNIFNAPVNTNLLITNFEGADPQVMKYVIFSSRITLNEFDTASGTSYGHANAVGAEAVGAAFYLDTPQFGVDPPQLELFSSAGGVPILFDSAGNRLPEPEVRMKPEIVAPDGTNTSFFGGSDIDSDGFPNFFGTSAAAPHAAAVAALMLEVNPSLTPAEICAILEQTALDMDDSDTPDFDVGFDLATGSGLIQADLAVSAVKQGLPTCQADFDMDGDVDGSDLSVFAAHFGRNDCNAGDPCEGDFDGDNDVDGSDIITFGADFGRTNCP
jgi:subtilisin family serine protease